MTAIRPRSFTRWILALAFVSLAAGSARAQLRLEDLVGTAVPGTGPFVQDVNDAIQSFGAGDYKTALARLQNAKKVTPALPPAEIMMARMLFTANQTNLANAMLEQAIQAAPQDPEAYIMLVERALSENRLTEADMLSKAAEPVVQAFNQNPRRKRDLQLRSYTAGAAIDQSRGKLEAAKAKLEALVRVDSRDANSHVKLGNVLFALNEQKAAFNEFKLAAEADPKTIPAELMMAMLATDQASAQKWLDYALKAHPGDLRTELGAANYLLKKNQVLEAAKHAEEAVKVDPTGYESNLVAGLAARLQGDFAKAEKHLSAAHMQQPADYGVMSHLSLVLVELPDENSHKRAQQFAELAVRDNPNNIDYLAGLGWVNYRTHRKREAERAFTAVFNSQQVKSTNLMTSEMAYFLAHLAKDQGNTAEATKLLTESLQTTQPFAYRKQAQQMLEQLSKTAGGKPGAGEASAKTGQDAR